MAEHGGNIYSQTGEKQNILDFSANINPFGINEMVKQAYLDGLKHLENYPDSYYIKLRNALATHHNIIPQEIVCGNGGADVIFRLVSAKKPKKAVIVSPTFSEYEKALLQYDCKIIYYDMDSTLTIKSNLIDIIDNSIDMLFLCNPNNPTGELIEPSFIKSILKKYPNTMVMIDECFNDLIENPEYYSLINEIKKYPNLFILKSLTKMYAIAGIRLGYGISSNQDFIEQIRQQGQAWPVSCIASEVGVVAVSDMEYPQKIREFFKTERDFLYNELIKLGLKVFLPSANYIFFQAEKNTELDKKLLSMGIMIRNCSNYRNLSNDYYRVAIRLREENKKLIFALRECLN